MSQAHSLPAAASESSELVAAEADYEALTEALMQTRRGRWFLTEHARRCREADHDDMRMVLARIEQTMAAPREPAGLAEMQDKLGALARIEQALADYRDPPAMAELRESLGALARIEQALAAPREPAGLAEMQDKLGALARIEQALADYRDPPAMAELRESLGALARIEQTMAAPREPAGLAEMQDKLGALARIEQALADYRDPPAMAELRESLGALARIEQTMAAPREPQGIAELREQVAAFAQTLDGVRAEVAARPPEPDPAESARDRDRDAEMLRLLHEQRERLDALADIWARVPAAPQSPPADQAREDDPAGEPAAAVAAADMVADPIDETAATEPQAAPIADMPDVAISALAADDQTDNAGSSAGEITMPPDDETPTAELLSQTVDFHPVAEPSPADAAPVQAVMADQDIVWTSDETAEARTTEPALATAVVSTDEAAAAMALSSAVDRPGEEPCDESPAASDAEPDAVPASVSSASPPADPVVPAHDEPAPCHTDPILQMFIDPEPPAPAGDEEHLSVDADTAPAPPAAELTSLPAWLVGAAGGEPQTSASGEFDAASGDIDAASAPTELEDALQADVIDDVTGAAADAGLAADDDDIFAPSPDAPLPDGAEPEPALQSTDDAAIEPEAVRADEPEHDLAPEFGSQPEPETVEPVVSKARQASPTASADVPEQQPDLATLTLRLLHQALSAVSARGAEPAPAARQTSPTPDDTATATVDEPDLRAAIAALRRAIGRDQEPAAADADAGDLVILDDLLEHPPAPAASRPSAKAPAPSDPLAPVGALREEERIALFS